MKKIYKKPISEKISMVNNHIILSSRPSIPKHECECYPRCKCMEYYGECHCDNPKY